MTNKIFKKLQPVHIKLQFQQVTDQGKTHWVFCTGCLPWVSVCLGSRFLPPPPHSNVVLLFTYSFAPAFQTHFTMIFWEDLDKARATALWLGKSGFSQSCAHRCCFTHTSPPQQSFFLLASMCVCVCVWKHSNITCQFSKIKRPLVVHGVGGWMPWRTWAQRTPENPPQRSTTGNVLNQQPQQQWRTPPPKKCCHLEEAMGD